MQKVLTFFGTVLLLTVFVVSAAAQDKLSGRWEGKVQSLRGEQPTTVIFKKTGEGYTGKTTGMRPGMEVELKDVKLEGDKVTAKAEIETPQATVVINYTFNLAGEAMKGQGALDFGGQAMTFDIELKRVSGDTEGPLVAASQAPAPARSGAGGTGGGGQQRQRVDVPQPQQKQSIDYFVGSWTFKYLGRESALWNAPREGVVTFTKQADGKSVQGMVEGKHDGGPFKESLIITFDETSKMMTFTEKLASGATLTSRGDWTSPITIRCSVDPVKVKGQTLQIRRTISVVSGHSFTITEELSEDGGPFVRLSNALYSKVEAK